MAATVVARRRPSCRPAAKQAGRAHDVPPVRLPQQAASRLATHALRPPPRPARSLAAGRRDRGYRPWPCARRAVERTDDRRPRLLGRAAFSAGGGHRLPDKAGAGAPLAPRRAAARCAGICDRRHDLAVQGRHRRRLQSGREAADGGDPYPLRPAGRGSCRDRRARQEGRPRLRLPRGDATRGIRCRGGLDPLRPAHRDLWWRQGRPSTLVPMDAETAKAAFLDRFTLLSS